MGMNLFVHGNELLPRHTVLYNFSLVDGRLDTPPRLRLPRTVKHECVYTAPHDRRYTFRSLDVSPGGRFAVSMGRTPRRRSSHDTSSRDPSRRLLPHYFPNINGPGCPCHVTSMFILFYFK
jgi:hypothetical protein